MFIELHQDKERILVNIDNVLVVKGQYIIFSYATKNSPVFERVDESYQEIITRIEETR